MNDTRGHFVLLCIFLPYRNRHSENELLVHFTHAADASSLLVGCKNVCNKHFSYFIFFLVQKEKKNANANEMCIAFLSQNPNIYSKTYIHFAIGRLIGVCMRQCSETESKPMSFIPHAEGLQKSQRKTMKLF